MGKLLMVISVVLLAASAQASSEYLDLRADGRSGGKPNLTVGGGNAAIDVWAFNVPGFPVLEVGHLEQIKLGHRGSSLVGGYVSYWEKAHQLYLEPWSKTTVQLGSWDLTAKLAGYAPLTGGGGWQLYSDQTSLVKRVGRDTKIGVYGTFWATEGQKLSGSLGPCASFQLGGHAQLNLRYGLGLGESNSLRVELTLF